MQASFFGPSAPLTHNHAIHQAHFDAIVPCCHQIVWCGVEVAAAGSTTYLAQRG
jgi:hypothetical protein